MKRGKVMNLLDISTTTVNRWRDEGKLKANKLPNGQWNYDKDNVYDLLLEHKPRVTAIYARVSTYKQKQDLQNQIHNLENYAAAQGIQVNYAYSDVASGITFDKRKQFFKMLKQIENGEINQILITHKDRLSRVGFDLFKTLCSFHDCQITVLSDIENPKTDSAEIFEEVINLLNSFNMSMYSQRRLKMKQWLNNAGFDTTPTTQAQRETGKEYLRKEDK